MVAPTRAPVSPRHALAAATAFLDAIAELAEADWMAIVAELGSNPMAATRRASAQAVLDAAVGAEEYRLARWTIYDGIQTLRFGATACSRNLVDDVYTAAADAALALLVRDVLPPDVFATLYGPFTSRAAAPVLRMER